MSYAEVAKDNMPPGTTGVDPIDWDKEKHEIKKDVNDAAGRAKKAGKAAGDRAKRELGEAESAIEAAWNRTMDVVLRPSTMGGLLGVVNVGLLGGLGYLAYENRDRPWDQRWVAGSIAGVLGLFTAEGFLADSYLQTPEGQAEAERAKAEGSRIYLQAKEVILRPQVAGGLAGAFNLAVLGTVGYFAHKHWNQPWDRKIVAGVVAGLATLSGVEGLLASEYDEKVLDKK